MTGVARLRAKGRWIALVLVAAASMNGLGGAHPSSPDNSWRDSFDTAGPLPGTLPADPYEIKSGSWIVGDEPGSLGGLTGPTNRVLMQTSRASTPQEPMVFVRDRPFRQMTAQVTAAFMDPLTAFGDLEPSSSLGIVFRSPISDGEADRNNLYLFGAIVTGVAPGFPTGRAFALFKRVGQGYFIWDRHIVHTWADLTKPHTYKVVMGGGHILCYVDGRLVIDARDRAMGDFPTAEDPLPALPFDNGAVGLRTSSARAWFDNFLVVGNEGYEGRASAIDAYAEYGSENSSVRRGAAVQVNETSRWLGLPTTDTGYVYHDHDFDDGVVRTVDNPSGGQPSVGARVSTSTVDGEVRSTVRLTHLVAAGATPNQQVTVSVTGQAIEATGTASCTATGSTMNVVQGRVTITFASQNAGEPDTVIGPIPINGGYAPNTVLLERSWNGLAFQLVAHARTAMSAPRRVEVTALKLLIPYNSGLRLPAQTLPGVPGGRTPEASGQMPPTEISIGTVVAGRYCQ